MDLPNTLNQLSKYVQTPKRNHEQRTTGNISNDIAMNREYH
jgi:hypothetical protein